MNTRTSKFLIFFLVINIDINVLNELVGLLRCSNLVKLTELRKSYFPHPLSVLIVFPTHTRKFS